MDVPVKLLHANAYRNPSELKVAGPAAGWNAEVPGGPLHPARVKSRAPAGTAVAGGAPIACASTGSDSPLLKSRILESSAATARVLPSGLKVAVASCETMPESNGEVPIGAPSATPVSAFQ